MATFTAEDRQPKTDVSVTALWKTRAQTLSPKRCLRRQAKRRYLSGTRRSSANTLYPFHQSGAPVAPIGSQGHKAVSSASNAATRAEEGHSADVTGTTRAAGSNQQVPDGTFTKQTPDGPGGRAQAGLGSDNSGQAGGAGGLKG